RLSTCSGRTGTSGWLGRGWNRLMSPGTCPKVVSMLEEGLNKVDEPAGSMQRWAAETAGARVGPGPGSPVSSIFTVHPFQRSRHGQRLLDQRFPLDQGPEEG